MDEELSQARTLPARLYLDPQVLAIERQRIFHRTWQWVGHEERLQRDGDYFTCEVQGQPLVLTRDDGAVRGFYNVCRHRAGAVAVGAGCRRALQCRYHGWTYGLDGGLLKAPEFQGVRSFAPGDHGLVPVPVCSALGLLFVNLAAAGASISPAVPSLAQTLGEILDEAAGLPLAAMRLHRRVDYEVGCNWKVYVDNYLEGYHIPLVHPALYKELDYDAYRVETRRLHSRQHAPLRLREGSVFTGKAEPGARALYYWVFPNLMLNVYPDNVQLNLVVPLSVERTLTVFEWYLLRPEDPAVAADFETSFAFSDQVQREDIAICEQVQRGLGSHAYARGRYSVARENGVHHFHRLVAEHLRG